MNDGASVQATTRGAQAVHDHPKGFSRIMWDSLEPAEFVRPGDVRRRLAGVDKPGLGRRHRSGRAGNEAAPDPRSAALEAKIRDTKQISRPTLYIRGGADGVNPPGANKDVPAKSSGPFEAIQLDGIGHLPTRETPDKVSAALIEHFSRS